jgi:outer membrane protein assembly factor BamD (BamD/ComL family)
MPGLPEETIGQIKLALADIFILTGEVWEATLTYSQIEKQYRNTALAQEAKFRNAKLAYFQGDFNWAKAQLDVLKSATSQLIANDALNLSLLIAENLSSPTDTPALKAYANADLLAFKNKLPEALSALGEIEKKFAGTSLADDILMAEAKIFLKQKQSEKAAGYLQSIIDNYAYDLWADDAFFMLGDLYEQDLKMPEKAKEYYQKLISGYPSSILANEARKRYRILRGDKIE